MRTFLLVSAVLFSGCGKDDAAPAPAPAATSPVVAANASLSLADASARALAACHKLEAAHVATGCHSTTDNASDVMGWGITDFTSVGGLQANDGSVVCYRTIDAYNGGNPALSAAPADDLPNQSAASPATRLWIGWPGKDDDKWDACRKHSKPAACAKEMPAAYAAYKNLDAVAKRVAAGG
jgi:hypothetical protein